MHTRVLKLVLPVAICTLIAACGSVGKVGKVDPASGYISTGLSQGQKAEVLTAAKVDLNKYKALAYVSDTAGSDFSAEQLRELGFFTEVLDTAGMEKRIVEKKLQDQIPGLNEPLSLNKLYRVYQPFLWVHLKDKFIEGLLAFQLIATDPETLTDVFVAQTQWNPLEGATDQAMRYPLYNAFIDWIGQNP